MSLADHTYLLREQIDLADGVPRVVDVRAFSRAVMYSSAGVLAATPRADNVGTAIPGASSAAPTNETAFDLLGLFYEFESTGDSAVVILLP